MNHRRLRYGILGTGNIALKRFVPGAAASQYGSVVAIASRDDERARAAAASAGIARAYGSYEALLADPEVDAIYIALPNALHASWALAAARARKPVLCEKPLARDAAEARDVADAFARAGLPLMEAFMYRFHPQHARVRESIADGSIGDVVAVRSAFMFRLPELTGANIRLSAALAGGALMDVGCYTVDAARMLFAEEPLWASAQWDFREDLGVDVALSGVLGFSGGRMASLDCSFRGAGKSTYSVVGTRGRIDCLDAFTPAATSRVSLLYVDANGERRIEDLPGVDQFAAEADAFARSVMLGEAVPIAAASSVANMRAIDALRTSAREGRRVSL